MTDNEQTPKTVVDAERKATYQKTRAASGAASLNNGDPTAEALAGVSLEDTYKIADKLLKEDFRQKYEHLNGGMQRMVVGNRIRAAVNKGDEFPTLGDLTKITDPIHKRNAVAADKAARQKEAEAKKKAAEKAKEKAAAKPKRTRAKKTEEAAEV